MVNRSNREPRRKPKRTIGIFKLFAYADSFDYLLLLIGTLGAVVHGAALPVFFVIFSKLLNGFGSNINSPDQTNAVVGKYALYLLYLGLATWVSSWAEVAAWMQTGERQAARIRTLYLEALLSQDVGFFDTDARTGEIVNSISSETLLIQDAISEKVFNSNPSSASPLHLALSHIAI
jgi:ATP-binding cassette subfamily B (MDR/TAP) protein 1